MTEKKQARRLNNTVTTSWQQARMHWYRDRAAQSFVKKT